MKISDFCVTGVCIIVLTLVNDLLQIKFCVGRKKHGQLCSALYGFPPGIRPHSVFDDNSIREIGA